MKLFKRKAEDKPAIKYKKESEYGTRRLLYYFDDDLGAMAYALESYNFILHMYHPPTYYWQTISDGHDKAWAERIAEHYNIKMPVKEQDNE